MSSTVFLLDVDNTLLDNDTVKADISKRIIDLVGVEESDRFWRTYEQVRQEYSFVDIPRTLARFSAMNPDDPNYPRVAALLLCYPFDMAVYPDSLETIAHLQNLGTAAILSDGDPVYQPAKIVRAGLATAVHDRVMVTDHKELRLARMMSRFPAERYVLIDDKATTLAKVKAQLGDRVTTIHVRQGKYAHGGESPPALAPDRSVESIGDLRAFTLDDFSTS